MLPFLNTLIKRTWIVLLLINVMVLNACKDSDKNNSLIFEELNDSLEQSNVVIKSSIDIIIAAFRVRLVKPAFVERARIYEPSINYIERESNEVCNYIGQLKIDLIKEADLDTANWGNAEQSKANKAISSIFIEQGKSDSLFLKLHRLRENILNVDSRLKNELEKKLNVGSLTFGHSIQATDDFAKFFFKKKNIFEVFSFLTKLQNEVILAEYRSILYCYNVSNSNDDSYSVEMPWVFQNSTCLRRGDNLKLKIVIAEARDNLDFKVTVDGEEIPNDSSSMRIYTKKMMQSPGKYNASVRVEFTNRYGQKEVENQSIEYQIFK